MLRPWLIAFLVVFCGAGSVVRAQKNKVDHGSVAGKVTIKGKPAAEIVVGMRRTDYRRRFESAFKERTDREGNYRINDVPPGTYQVGPSAPAFVTTEVSEHRTQTVVVSEGENVEGIDFALVPGGVITGRVVDADGRPVIDQQVNLIMVDTSANQGGPSYPFIDFATDDRGIYRMFGIPAGHYKVAVGGNEDGFGSGPSFSRQTFYPAVTEASQAVIVEVTEGSESANIDITVGAAPQTFSASGSVVDSENSRRLAGVRLGIELRDEHGSFSTTASTSNSRGEFTIEHLAPGKYFVFLEPGGDENLRSESVAFEITDRDVNGLVVKTLKGGASLAGTIVLENTDNRAVFAALMELRVTAYVVKPVDAGPGFGPGFPHSAVISFGGNFRLKGLEPGLVKISLPRAEVSGVKGFTVLRVERDGIIQPRGIEVKKDDEITGVRVVVGYGSGVVEGIVRVENGAMAPGTRISITVTREGQPVMSVRPEVDARGHFMIEGLPGGVYNFETNVSVPTVGGGARLLRSAKQQVTVAERGVTNVIITVDGAHNPGPTP